MPNYVISQDGKTVEPRTFQAQSDLRATLAHARSLSGRVTVRAEKSKSILFDSQGEAPPDGRNDPPPAGSDVPQTPAAEAPAQPAVEAPAAGAAATPPAPPTVDPAAETQPEGAPVAGPRGYLITQDGNEVSPRTFRDQFDLRATLAHARSLEGHVIVTAGTSTEPVYDSQAAPQG